MKLMQIYEAVINVPFYHGTSSTRMEGIQQEGLKNPDLTTDYDKAEYYAEEAVYEFGGEVVVLEIKRYDKSKFRVNFPELEEPVSTSNYSIKEMKKLVKKAYKKYAKKHPDSVNKKYGWVSVKPKHYWMSLDTTETVKYKGIIPPQDLREV